MAGVGEGSPAPAIQERVRSFAKHNDRSLLNLAVNALEAVGPGASITIGTAALTLASPRLGFEEIPMGDYVVLSVTDDGPGIPTDALDQVFEPFFSKKALGRSGTGLGLAVVWSVVHDAGGYIDVRSSAAGTRFDLYFRPGQAEASAVVEGGGLERWRGRGQKILVVDDEPSQRRISAALLGRLGYEVATVCSGAEALAWLAHDEPALVLLDMMMPMMNGLETFKAARELVPGLRAVIVSGYSATEDVHEVQRLGAGPLVSKPFSVGVLGRAVFEELRRPLRAG